MIAARRIGTIASVLVVIALFTAPAWSADTATQPGASTQPAAKGAWTEIKIDKGSWAWGRRGALALDRLTGNLFLATWRPPGLQASSDFGKTFTRLNGTNLDGNPFSAYAVFAAAEGGKLAMFGSQGKVRVGHSLDGGKTWTLWTDIPARGFDYGVVDWESGAIFAMPHEEYNAYFSPDMGKTWAKLAAVDFPGGRNKPHDVGKFKYSHSGIGIFGAKELVYSHDSGTGIQRSDDGGKTWAKVADYFCQGPVQVYKGVGYWLAKKEDKGKWSGILLATKDKGKTWQPVGKPIDNGESTYITVPRFGKDEKHILVAAAEGIMESTNGGDTWKLAVKYPQASAGNVWSPFVDTLDCFEYDPVHDAFYMFFVTDHGDGVIRVPPIWVYRR